MCCFCVLYAYNSLTNYRKGKIKMKISIAIRKASKKLPKVCGKWYNQKSYFDNSYAKMQRRRDVVFNTLIMLDIADKNDIEQAVYNGGFYNSIDDLLFEAALNLKIVIE